MQRKDGLENGKFYLGICKLNDKEKKIIYKNPHCVEFFCNMNNIKNCTQCVNKLINEKNIKLFNPEFNNEKYIPNNKYCNKYCNHGYIYDYIDYGDKKLLIKNNNIDKFKNINNFYNKKFVYKYDDIPYIIKYESTFPKPKSVVHWGQLKMLLITLIFFINKIDPNDINVHIIYPGSARGDDILILCDLFPNTNWHLIDPRPHHPNLKNNKQIKEIISDFFTEETAKYFYEKFKNRNHKLLFISDIRSKTDDTNVLIDQEKNIIWHKIINPDYSFFKFRCNYEGNKIYKYYKGEIFLQPYAPMSSTESRILLSKDLEEYEYNIEEYQGKFLYFNRIIRPSFFIKSIIKNNNYFDHCYDCTYFSYLIKNYLNKFSLFNPYKTTNIFNIMKIITNKISKFTNNKIAAYNSYIRNNIK
jgi:hypothetical protein